MPGEAERMLCDLARTHGLWLVPGSLYERREGAVYTTAPVIDPEGKVVARYRKLFPFAPYERDVEPGSQFVVFDVPAAARFGVSTCYDLWFPAPQPSLVSLGAALILPPPRPNPTDPDV